MGIHMDIDSILAIAIERGASDIHLVSGEPAVIRVDTDLVRLDDVPIQPEDLRKQIATMLNENQQKTLQEQQDVDLSWESDEDEVMKKTKLKTRSK